MPRKNYPVLLCVILLIVNLAFLRGADNHNHEHPEGHSHGECEAPKNKEDNPEKTKKLITIGLFLDVSCVARNIDDHMHEELQMPGYDYGHVHGGDHSHTALNAGKGFNLNYGELVLSASPGKYFDIYTVFHLSEHAFEIEEAYLATRSLPYGFRLKAGKFFSAFGRINAIHAHRRNFTCQPLIYRAFFGCHGLWEKGIQINWKAPVDFLLNLSVEALQGENAHSFGSEGFHVIDADTEDQLEIPTPQLPNLYNLMVDTAIETGPFHASAGLSYALGNSRFNFFEDDEQSHGFAGNNRILGIDFSAHYDFDRHRYLLLQAEFLTRKLDGTRYARHVHGDDEDDTEPLQRGFFRTFETDEHNHGDTGIPEVEQVPQTMTQSGFYAQLIYRFHRLWQIGARWDNLDKNSIRVDGLLQPLPGALNRYGFMMGFKLDSFLKLRLEYNINRFGYLDGMLKNYHELALHAVVTIGKHGNHGTHGNSDAHGTHCTH